MSKRAQNRQSKQTGYIWSAEVSRIQSLGGGTTVRLRDQLGKEHTLPRTSPELIALCVATDEAMDGLITRQLTELGFDDILESMEATPQESEIDSE